MKDSKKKKPDKEPAVSSDEILKILTSPMSEEVSRKKNSLDSRDFDFSSKEKQEEEVIKLLLKEEKFHSND
jgi:hypothetical protein